MLMKGVKTMNKVLDLQKLPVEEISETDGMRMSTMSNYHCGGAKWSLASNHYCKK